MKIHSTPGHIAAKLHQAPRYPKPAMSFKEAFDGGAVASSHHAISFDATGLWGALKAQVADETPAPVQPPVASISSASAAGDDLPEVAFAASTALAASGASALAAGASACKLSKPEYGVTPAVQRLHKIDTTAGSATAAVVAGVSPALRVPWAAEWSGLAAPAPTQPALSARDRSILPQTNRSETPETAFAEVTTDRETGGQQLDGAAEAVSVIVSESDGEVQIVAAAPDISDEARRQVREAAQDIAREAGIRINGLSLNGAALIHKPEPDRRTSWRSHL